MIPQIFPGVSAYDKEKAAETGRFEQGPEFLHHGMALALQRRMIELRRLQDGIEGRESLISHW